MRTSGNGFRPIRELANLAIASIFLVACGSAGNHPTAAPTSSTVAPTTAARPTTTTSPAQAAAAQHAADATAIIAMFRADNDAWNASRTAGINADVADTWPGSREAAGMTFGECDRYLNAGLWTNTVIEASTIQLQPGWIEPLTHTVPKGRIYIMTSTISTRYGAAVQPTQTQEIHAVMAPDGHPYSFLACRG